MGTNKSPGSSAPQLGQTYRTFTFPLMYTADGFARLWPLGPDNAIVLKINGGQTPDSSIPGSKKLERMESPSGSKLQGSQLSRASIKK